jgi:hypothetical protein
MVRQFYGSNWVQHYKRLAHVKMYFYYYFVANHFGLWEYVLMRDTTNPGKE